MSFYITSFYRQSDSLWLLRSRISPFLSACVWSGAHRGLYEMIQLDKSAND